MSIFDEIGGPLVGQEHIQSFESDFYDWMQDNKAVSSAWNQDLLLPSTQQARQQILTGYASQWVQDNDFLYGQSPEPEPRVSQADVFANFHMVLSGYQDTFDQLSQTEQLSLFQAFNTEGPDAVEQFFNRPHSWTFVLPHEDVQPGSVQDVLLDVFRGTAATTAAQQSEVAIQATGTDGGMQIWDGKEVARFNTAARERWEEIERQVANPTTYDPAPRQGFDPSYGHVDLASASGYDDVRPIASYNAPVAFSQGQGQQQRLPAGYTGGDGRKGGQFYFGFEITEEMGKAIGEKLKEFLKTNYTEREKIGQVSHTLFRSIEQAKITVTASKQGLEVHVQLQDISRAGRILSNGSQQRGAEVSEYALAVFYGRNANVTARDHPMIFEGNSGHIVSTRHRPETPPKNIFNLDTAQVTEMRDLIATLLTEGSSKVKN